MLWVLEGAQHCLWGFSPNKQINTSSCKSHFLDSEADSTGAKSTGTHIHMDNTRGHTIPMGTCFSFCVFVLLSLFYPVSLNSKVSPTGKQRIWRGGGNSGRVCGSWSWGKGSWPPMQKVNKFALNDFSNEFWDKGSPAETGGESIRSFKRSWFGEKLLMGKTK